MFQKLGIILILGLLIGSILSSCGDGTPTVKAVKGEVDCSRQDYFNHQVIFNQPYQVADGTSTVTVRGFGVVACIPKINYEYATQQFDSITEQLAQEYDGKSFATAEDLWQLSSKRATTLVSENSKLTSVIINSSSKGKFTFGLLVSD